MTESAPDPDLPPRPPHPRRGWRRFAGALLLVLALLVAGVLASATSGGFAWTLQRLASVSGGTLGLASVRGTLWDGFVLGGIRIRSAGFDADIDSLAVDWRPAELWHGRVQVERLALGTVTLTPHPAGGPTPLPADLSLPLPLAIRHLSIDALTVMPDALRAYSIVAGYRYGGGAHELVIERLALPSGQASARLRLAAARPFALAGQLTASGLLDGVPASGRLDLSGSLQTLHLDGNARGSTIRGDVAATLLPFASGETSRFQRVDLRLSGIDPHALLPRAPRARIDLALYAVPTAGGRIRGAMTLVNHDPGDLATGRLPVRLLAGAVSGAGRRWRLEQWQAQLTQGRVTASGELDSARLDVAATLHGVALRSLHPDAPDDTVDGSMQLGGNWSVPRLAGRLDGRWLSVATDLSLAESRRLDIHRLRLGLGRGAIDVGGVLQLDGERAFHLDGQLSHADPARLHPRLPRGDISASLELHGHLAGSPAADVSLDIARSQLSGAPLSGRLRLALAPRRLTRAEADLRLGANHVRAHGAFGATGDRLRLDLDAPALSLLGPDFAGALKAGIDVSGTPAAPVFSGQLGARRLRVPGGIAAQTLDVEGELRATANGLFRIQALGTGLQAGGLTLERLAANVSGSRARHRLEWTARGRHDAQAFSLALVGDGGLSADDRRWSGSVQRLELGGAHPLTLLAPVRLELGPQRQALLTPARLAVAGGSVLLTRLERRGDGGLSSAGQLSGVRLALPLSQGLTVGGDWDLRYDSVWTGSLRLSRQAGDVQWQERALGLEAAELKVAAASGIARFAVTARARQGRLEGTGTLAFHGLLPDARSSLVAGVRLDVPQLDRLAALAGPEFELGGRLTAALTVAGPLERPRLGGRIDGRELTLADHRTGIRLAGGELQARLDGQRLLLDRLHFSSGDGEVLARGELGLREDGPAARVSVTLRRFSVFDHPGRRLVVSGDGELALVKQVFTLRGRLRADQGRIELPKLGTPALSGDVHVRGRAPPAPSALENLPFSAELTLDLGDHFHFGGQGLDTQLTGQVTLSASPGRAPAAHGQVRVLSGRYKAYGQDLDIEYGVVTFTGPLDNPHLNVRARRRLSSVGAGVEVSGTVQAPQIRLISTESLSDRDKLAWLVLGRAASSNTRDDSAMASAGALLAGSLNDQVGVFDDVGMSSRNERVLRDGRISPAEQVVTVGRQLSQEFYLGYEYGISSAQQAVKLIIQLGRNWSLVLRAGVDASAESRYTLRFD
jgi:translocation and assembly module TamB